MGELAVVDMNESCLTWMNDIAHAWIISLTWLSCVAQKSPDTHDDEQRATLLHAAVAPMSVCERYDSFICVTYSLLHAVVYPTYVRERHDSFIRVTWLIAACCSLTLVGMLETWIIHTYGTTYCCMLQSLACLYLMNMTHSYVCHDSFPCNHDSFTCETLHIFVSYERNHFIYCICVLWCFM